MTTDTTQIIILGAGYAGMITALRLAHKTRRLPMRAHLADNLHAQVINQPPQPFRMCHVAQCISLGRRDALIQVVNADDSPTQRAHELAHARGRHGDNRDHGGHPRGQGSQLVVRAQPR